MWLEIAVVAGLRESNELGSGCDFNVEIIALCKKFGNGSVSHQHRKPVGHSRGTLGRRCLASPGGVDIDLAHGVEHVEASGDHE